MISFICSLEIINVLTPDPNILTRMLTCLDRVQFEPAKAQLELARIFNAISQFLMPINLWRKILILNFVILTLLVDSKKKEVDESIEDEFFSSMDELQEILGNH